MDKDIRSVTEKGEILYVVSLAFLYWLNKSELPSFSDGRTFIFTYFFYFKTEKMKL